MTDRVDLDTLDRLYAESQTVSGGLAEIRNRPGIFVEVIKEQWPALAAELRALRRFACHPEDGWHTFNGQDICQCGRTEQYGLTYRLRQPGPPDA